MLIQRHSLILYKSVANLSPICQPEQRQGFDYLCKAASGCPAMDQECLKAIPGSELEREAWQGDTPASPAHWEEDGR